MIHADTQQILEDLKDFAPARLTRANASDLRGLYRRAMVAFMDTPEGADGWEDEFRVYLTRDDRKLAMARLGGKGGRYVRVRAQWKRERVIGLNVAITSFDRPLKLPTGSVAIGRLIAEHRFRHDTSEQQFMREVARYVRLGLGHCKREESRLVNILS